MRRAAAQRACEILGATAVFFGDLPDNRLDSIALLDIVRIIEALIAEYRPDTVFTHHAGDVNIDHRRMHEAAITACRPQTKPSRQNLPLVRSAFQHRMAAARIGSRFYA